MRVSSANPIMISNTIVLNAMNLNIRLAVISVSKPKEEQNR